VALGGWATPSNRDYYVWQYLIAIIPSVLCLAGYPDVRQLPSLPSLKFLLVEEHPELDPLEYLPSNTQRDWWMFCSTWITAMLFHPSTDYADIKTLPGVFVL
jgi:hypothetical protein